MALRKILTQEDETLTKVSRPVKDFNRRLHTLLDDMLDTLRETGGVGLAAPQVGVLRRAVVIETEEGGLLELINPELLSADGEQDGGEGCLSVPGQYGMVKRPMTAVVRAQDRRGKTFEVTGEALLARALCHEIDHLNGLMFTRLVTRWLDPEEKEEGEKV
jgi:peptide deformylase